jgi:hypothetical protein
MTAAMLHVVETASSRMKAGVVYRNDAENLHLAINRLQFWQQHNVARSQYRERIAALVSEEVSPVSSADARMTA